jgi:ParB family chromosome partitioning protein
MDVNQCLFDPPAAEVRDADSEIASRAKRALKRSGESSWEAADCFLELSERGWTQARIGKECGASQSSVSKFIACARRYSLANNRPAFWDAYREVDGRPVQPADLAPVRQAPDELAGDDQVETVTPTGNLSVSRQTDEPDGTEEPEQEEDKPRPAYMQQCTGRQDWYTPGVYLDAARAVLGAIDLDPASSDAAQQLVQAGTYFTKDDDGLAQPWAGKVWLNPPCAQPLVTQFTEKLAEHFKAGDVTAAVVLVNNATETQWFQTLASEASAVCFLVRRVRFLDADGSCPKGGPLQGQAVLYLGDRVDRFLAAFTPLGMCWVRGQEPTTGKPVNRDGAGGVTGDFHQ